MSMKFETPDRPNKGLVEKLANNDTTLSKIPFPTQLEEPYSNFQEVLASERYKDIVENFRKYNKTDFVLTNNNFISLMTPMSHYHNSIITLEYNHHTELENLAIELVTKEMGIPEGSFIFDVKLVDSSDIEGSGFNHGGGEQTNLPEVDIEELELPLSNGQELEIAKRRLINAIIQGSSKRGHFMYHIVEDRIKQIIGNDNIIELYGAMMSINDAMYWQLPDIYINMAGGNGGDGSYAAKEEIDRNTTPPTIYVRAVNFPTLVHELIKGIMEVFAIHGLPENYSDFAEQEETIENETWDLRLGPSIWKRLRAQFPIEIIMDEEKVELQNYLLVEIFKLPAREFLYFMREIMKGSDEGKRMMNELMRKVDNNINEEEMEDTDE